MPQTNNGLVISDIDFSLNSLPDREFEQVEFRNCTFSNLAGIDFGDCTFYDCNLSNAIVNNSKMDNVTFVNCKLIGVNFSTSKDFAFQISADNCILDFTVFDQKKLNKSIFKSCRFHSADFTQSDLSKCRFDHCDFLNAAFANSNLAGLDFTTCSRFTIDPTINNIKKAKFMSSDLAGLLTKFGIIVK